MRSDFNILRFIVILFEVFSLLFILHTNFLVVYNLYIYACISLTVVAPRRVIQNVGGKSFRF